MLAVAMMFFFLAFSWLALLFLPVALLGAVVVAVACYQTRCLWQWRDYKEARQTATLVRLQPNRRLPVVISEPSPALSRKVAARS